LNAIQSELRRLVPWLGLLLGACGAPGVYSPNPGPYDRIPDAWEEPLFVARRHLNEGEPDRAHEILVRLTQEDPRILPVRIFLQELELELLVERGRAGRLSFNEPERAREYLGNHYLTKAEGNPTPESFVLAARLETEYSKAIELLNQAEALDPRCVWVPYARAWWNFTDYHFTSAEDAVREAFRLDSGHLATMRLHALMLTAEGETRGALKVLEQWWKRMRNDPLVSPEMLGAALFDLASLHVLAGEPREALQLLENVDQRVLDQVARLEEVRAAAYEGLDDYVRSHEAIRRARELDPDDPLPLVQEAMLLARQREEEAELVAWQRLLDHLDATEGRGFGAMIRRIQALTRLQRAERARREAALAAAEAEPGPGEAAGTAGGEPVPRP